MSKRRHEEPLFDSTDTTSTSVYNPQRIPDFTNDLWKMSRERWKDHILRMIKENQDYIDEEVNGYYIFLTSSNVEFIFTLCVRLQLPNDVRYLSILLFDRYMTTQIASIHNEVYSSKDDDELKAERWGNVLNRFYSQSVLRIVSCLSIAVKALYYKLTLTTKKQYQILRSMNFMYDDDAIQRSESRVFSAIMFEININRSPVFMIEHHICFLIDQHKELIGPVDPEAIWEYSILYCDFVYLNLNPFYCKLFRQMHGEPSGVNEIAPERIWKLEADYLTLTSSVVLTSIHVLHGDEKVRIVANLFRKHMKVDQQEMIEFVTVLRDMILEYEPEQPTIILPEELLGLKKVNGSYSPSIF
ncbi:unnamed protein product [Bursaphelenchus okinawaensis]|uniref:Cyclin N-terminal domain-containing protein n=1 Tax=Bursaphelenchus okinawaensis TaxID=465554 RepID=A0A811LMU0_9BILA|nr:unnamed protein product [Bursaphelenchus okinawaensis]CAG9124257.1 unnamed protein product [Bursaphelenchus okinawaensis]